MSIVPNDALKPVESLELPIFPLNFIFAVSPLRMDIFTRYQAFWKRIIIRNYSNAENIFYRVEANSDDVRSVPPLSERPVRGWGSFIELTGTNPDGELFLECVRLTEALRR